PSNLAKKTGTSHHPPAAAEEPFCAQQADEEQEEDNQEAGEVLSPPVGPKVGLGTALGQRRLLQFLQEVGQFLGRVELAAAGVGQLGEKVVVGGTPHQLRV